MGEHGPDGKAVILGKDFEVRPGVPLPHLASPATEAFEAIDRRSPAKAHFALVCQQRLMPRLELIPQIADLSRLDMLTPEEWGIAHWPPAGGERYITVFQRPAGERIMAGPDASFAPPREDDLIRVFLRSLLPVLNNMNARVLTHRAIRADNLFYKDSTRQQVLLGECISTPPGLCQPVIYETIENGMANPGGRGPGYLSDDLYALGVLLAVLLAGGNPCAGMSDQEIVATKLRLGSYGTLVSRVRASLGLMEPLRGLLHDDPRERWSMSDLIMWLDGRKLTPKAPVMPSRAARGFHFAGKDHWTLRSIAYAIRCQWGDAAELLQGSSLADWVKRSFTNDKLSEDVAKALRLAAATAGAGEGAEDRLVCRSLMALDPRSPLQYRGFSASIDSLGQCLAVEFHKPGTVANFLDLINNKLPYAWLEAQPASRPEFLQIRKGLDMVSYFAKRPRFCFGIERCLYELNPGWPCQSPLLKSHLVCSLDHLLPALESLASEGQLDQIPVDAHIAAFCAAIMKKLPERLLNSLAETEPEEMRALAKLALLAEVQKAAGPRQLPALTGWFVRELLPMIESFHHRPYRRDVAVALEQAAEKGQLVALIALLNNPEARGGDHAGFEYAKLQYQQAAREIAWLNGGGMTNPKVVAEGSQQASVLVSGLLSGLLMVVLAVSFVL